jgi:hypothetical protein
MPSPVALSVSVLVLAAYGGLLMAYPFAGVIVGLAALALYCVFYLGRALGDAFGGAHYDRPLSAERTTTGRFPGCSRSGRGGGECSMRSSGIDKGDES